MSYNLQKFLILTGLYLTLCLMMSVALESFNYGFGVVTVGLLIIRAVAIKIQQ